LETTTEKLAARPPPAQKNLCPLFCGRGHYLGQGYHLLGRNDEAIKLRKETWALETAKLGPKDPYTLMTMGSLAEDLIAAHRGAEALPILDECFQSFQPMSTVNPILLFQLIDLRLFQDEKDAAGCRQTAAMWEKLKRTDVDALYKSACLHAVTGVLASQG
jgi:hypothetical protein